MEEKISMICSSLIEFLKNIPLTELMVGVVVPIVAAWVSYFLAERAIRKKENNRLYVQIELIRRELLANDKCITHYLDYVNKENDLRKALEFPLVFLKDFLISMLDELQHIKETYMHSGEFILEQPIRLYIIGQELDNIETQIKQLESQYYADKILDEKRKIKLSEKLEEREKLIKEGKSLKDKDIYKEFMGFQNSIERRSIEGMFDKADNEEDNFVLAKYIYQSIKSFNEKPDKKKEDVVDLYRKLVLFQIDSDIVKEDFFDQESFDLYYRGFERPEGIEKKLYDLCERYYKFRVTNRLISNYAFEFENARWNENCSDFIIINDREIYISIVELYEEFNNINGILPEENREENYEYATGCHKKIQNIISDLQKHESKLKKKCK